MPQGSDASRPSLAICLGTKDRAEALRATLIHLAQIDELIDEVVVCDDASTDHTQAVIDELRVTFPRLRYVRHKTDIGAARNANAALSLSHCRYQYLLADDGRLEPAAIRAALRQLESDQNAVAVYGESRVAAPTRYTSADGPSLVQEFESLRYPVLRTSAYQRHCYYDDKSHGDWRLVQQLLRCGAIWMVPDCFQSDVAVDTATDSALLTAEYHDHHRSDWELYFSSLGITPETGPAAAALIFERLTSILDQARLAALGLTKPTIERDFILRRRAHGQRSIDIERDWEKRGLIAATVERAIEQLVATKSNHVLVEAGTMNLPSLIPLFEAALPLSKFAAVDRSELATCAAHPRTALIGQDWSVFAERQAAGIRDDGVCRIAWGDLIAALRLTHDTGGRLLKGPAGTTHLATL
jgi:glycosyltransferase involved in cell wall biosynthesis